jgi:hypothetical protein
MSPKCSDEWTEEDDDDAVVDLYDAITRIELHEEFADEFNYEDGEEENYESN